MFRNLIIPFFLLIQWTNALHFYLNTGETKCFFEELYKDTLVVGKFDTYEYDDRSNDYIRSQDLGLKITVDETFDNDHRVVNQIGHSDFTFTSLDSGEHKFCITPSYTGGSRSKKHRIFLDMVTGEANQFVDSKRQSDVDTLTNRVKDLNKKLEEIHREQELMREREALFRDQSESTNTRVVRWSVIQLLVLAGTCVWQMRHLKGFFVKQKIV